MISKPCRGSIKDIALIRSVVLIKCKQKLLNDSCLLKYDKTEIVFLWENEWTEGTVEIKENTKL